MPDLKPCFCRDTIKDATCIGCRGQLVATPDQARKRSRGLRVRLEAHRKGHHFSRHTSTPVATLYRCECGARLSHTPTGGWTGENYQEKCNG